jgi:hypothetical protein
MNPNLFRHVNGVPSLAALGHWSLAYQHPDDLHMTLIFNEVSEEFVETYVTTRTWCRDASCAQGCTKLKDLYSSCRSLSLAACCRKVFWLPVRLFGQQ